MSYQIDKKTGEITIGGWDKGIASSPTKGIANMQAVNISTESGEVMCSYNRTLQSQLAGSGTFTQVNTNTVSVSGISLLPGSWVHITNGGTTGLTGDYYYPTTGKLSRILVQSPTRSSLGASLLVVGAGGGGGKTGGGGGGGQVQTSPSYVLTIGAYAVTIGTGGAGSNVDGATGTIGGSSIFDAITSIGGAGGGSFGANGANGGLAAGGGGGAIDSGSPTTGGTGTQAGGAGVVASGANRAGGGGGGASATGTDATSGQGGNGGIGSASSISGSSVTYAGGGGGGSATTAGTGGAGGGANGSTGAGNNGTANTGGGGGGANGAAGGNGGSGVVILSYPTGIASATGGTITTSGGNTIHTFTSNGTFTLNSLSNYITGITAGSATFTVYSMGSPLQSASEIYTASDNTTQYRYYILDSLGQVWIHDTFTLSGMDTPLWFMSELSISGSKSVSGIAVLNGELTIALDNITYWKNTSTLDVAFSANTYILSTNKIHSTLVGSQGKLYVTDGNFITSMFPDTSLVTGGANIQSVIAYTAVTTTITLSRIIGGSLPTLGAEETRLPVVFFTNATGNLPTAISRGTIYYLDIIPVTGTTYPQSFNVYSAITGGSPIDAQTGAAGPQFLTTFWPFSSAVATFTYTQQRLNLPFFETAQCMVELGNNVIIGGVTNRLYPWNQVSSTPQDIVYLPESNTTNLITVENVAYAFTGKKGNIYITNGSSVSLGISVPDYCAGISGTASSYYEPYFSWGGAMFARGRVWFSILDQTATKAGNCGGLWSFVPTQNFSSVQDTGMALRLDNQASYGSYNGVSPVLLASYTQDVVSPQYWNAWYSSISAPTYGIDFTGTTTSTPAVIETDLISTGEMLEKKTFSQIKYKVTSPLQTNESVTISYRQNSTDAYATTNATISDNSLSGYVPANFQTGQFVQLKITLTPLATSSSSFCRLLEVKIL